MRGVLPIPITATSAADLQCRNPLKLRNQVQSLLSVNREPSRLLDTFLKPSKKEGNSTGVTASNTMLAIKLRPSYSAGFQAKKLF